MNGKSDVLRFSNDDSYVQITFCGEDKSSYATGDVNLGVDVSSAGFSGGIGTWVVSSDFTRFCKQLKQLDSLLKGGASLESASPDELTLRIYAVNSRGGIGVDVSIGRWLESIDDIFQHSVKVGFESEPHQLARALALPWIAKRL